MRIYHAIDFWFSLQSHVFLGFKLMKCSSNDHFYPIFLVLNRQNCQFSFRVLKSKIHYICVILSFFLVRDAKWTVGLHQYNICTQVQKNPPSRIHTWSKVFISGSFHSEFCSSKDMQEQASHTCWRNCRFKRKMMSLACLRGFVIWSILILYSFVISVNAVELETCRINDYENVKKLAVLLCLITIGKKLINKLPHSQWPQMPRLLNPPW